MAGSSCGSTRKSQPTRRGANAPLRGFVSQRRYGAGPRRPSSRSIIARSVFADAIAALFAVMARDASWNKAASCAVDLVARSLRLRLKFMTSSISFAPPTMGRVAGRKTAHRMKVHHLWSQRSGEGRQRLAPKRIRVRLGSINQRIMWRCRIGGRRTATTRDGSSQIQTAITWLWSK